METIEQGRPRPDIARRLSATLPRVLRELSRDYDRRVTRKLHQRGHTAISLSHQVVFANLGFGTTRVTELADRAQITQQAMGKTLKELEKLGYLERSIDPADRRARAITITDKGLALVADAIACIEETRQEYAARIGAQQWQELDTRLREAASKLDLDYLPRMWAESEET